MKRKGSITVKKIVHEKVSKDVFGDMPLREIERRTGIDVAYLSRVRSGKSPITEENLAKIIKVVEAAKHEQETISRNYAATGR